MLNFVVLVYFRQDFFFPVVLLHFGIHKRTLGPSVLFCRVLIMGDNQDFIALYGYLKAGCREVGVPSDK